MATIQQQIEVAADPALVSSNWARFIEWAHIGPSRLTCDELACVDAVRAGLVDFVPAAHGRTTVIFRMEQPENGPAPVEIKRRLGHDLLVFKDYIERSGLVDGAPAEATSAATQIQSDSDGARPRHAQPNSQTQTTSYRSWRSHYPS